RLHAQGQLLAPNAETTRGLADVPAHLVEDSQNQQAIQLVVRIVVGAAEQHVHDLRVARLTLAEGDVLRGDHPLSTAQGRAPQRVAELADVSRPRVALDDARLNF